MRNKIIILLFSILYTLSTSGATKEPTKPALNIIPKPESVRILPGNFTLGEGTILLITGVDTDLVKNAISLSRIIRFARGPVIMNEEIKESKAITSFVELSITPKTDPLAREGYKIKVTKNKVTITSGGGPGLFYGIQTFLQMLPSEVCDPVTRSTFNNWKIPCCEIKDKPRYPYRGMHLDVSRHFFPKEFIKKYIDLISMYKMNTFHWHLTDDHGWRIEIKKYPKLTEIGAWRVDRENLPWMERPVPGPGEKATYGGFYTQDDIREIVAYANSKYVTIIPEIEMPAHCLAALAAYPELSCTGGPFYVAPGSYWPNVDIFCAGNDSTFAFLEGVLAEIIPLFPSRYIHIGGDEAEKSRWKTCPKCQSRMKSEGLKNEKELQSYFIKRIEKFLISKNKKLIGWDEILEGGLAPEATVMSWRGIEGGISAARQGHNVIMTPSPYCYFDFYQSDPSFEPKAIGGMTTLKKVYSFEPTPHELNPTQARFILGAQGNLWTEYISTPEHAEYMAVPRMIALSEVVWSPKKARNWDDFRERLDVQFARLGYLNVNYSKGSFRVDVKTYLDKATGTMKARLTSEQPGCQIRYTLDGNDPTGDSRVYEKPVDILKNSYLKAGIFVDGKLRGKLTERNILIHKASGKKVSYLQPYSYRYAANGDVTLVDGIRGTTDHRQDWLGFLGNDMDVVIDLKTPTPIKTVFVTFLHDPDKWIFFPDSVTFSLSSNGKQYHSVNEQRNDVSQKEKGPVIKLFSQTYPDTPARYIRVHAKNVGTCPSWHEGNGEPCWLFADEIVVY